MTLMGVLAARTIVSLPKPPVALARPRRTVMVSLSGPPSIWSAPPPPSMVSLPARPLMISAALVPCRLSSPEVPPVTGMTATVTAAVAVSNPSEAV